MGICVDPVLVQQLFTDGNVPGYPALDPLRGRPIYFHFQKLVNDDPNIIRVRPRNRLDLPKYLPPPERMSPSDADATVQTAYPEMDMGYFRLIIAAKGVAESGIGMIPMLLIHGPTGVGKTNTLRAVASALGEKEFGLIAQKPDNYGEALGSGACTSSIIHADEIFKFGREAWEENLRPLFLSAGRSYTYRPLYHGTRTVPFNSALFLCDTELPDYVRKDEQFARRTVYVRLTRRVPDWRTGPDVGGPWWKSTPQLRLAAESIISEIIDDHFAPGSRAVFEEIAARLGFKTLEQNLAETEDGARLRELCKKLFFAVCDPGVPAVNEDQHLGIGWKLVPREQPDHRLASALQALADELGCSVDDGINAIRKFDGQWHTLVGAQGPARFETKKHGGKLHVRFCDGKSKNICVNEALLPDGYQPQSGATPATVKG